MKLENEPSQVLYGENFDGRSPGLTRETLMQLIAAGILFPDEIRHAEQLLRRMNAQSRYSSHLHPF